MCNILDVPRKQCALNVCPFQYSQSSDQQGCRNLYTWLIFDNLSTLQKKSFSESQLKRDPEQKKTLVMTLSHQHYPNHSLRVVSDSFARYLPLMSFSRPNSNPYTCNFPSYIQTINVQNNPTKFRFALNIDKSKSQRN